MFRTLCLAAAVVVACAGAGRADQLDDIKARGTIVCGVLSGYEPFGFVDPATGKPTGYEPEVCNGLAKFLGVTPQFKPITAQGRIPELLQGRVDVEVALLSWTPEREKQVDFTNTYAGVATKIMVLKASGLKTPEDLANRKIGVAKGSNQEFVGRARFPNATILGFDDTPAAYLALRQGKVAGILFTETTLASLRNLDPEGDRSEILPTVYEDSQISVVLRKGEPQLAAAINQYLDATEKSGEAQAMFDRWFGANSKLHLTRVLKMGTPIKRD